MHMAALTSDMYKINSYSIQLHIYCTPVANIFKILLYAVSCIKRTL